MRDDLPEKPLGKDNEAPEKLPLGQVLLDDIYFLLALGLIIPFLLYTLWGVLEVLHVPPA